MSGRIFMAFKRRRREHARREGTTIGGKLRDLPSSSLARRPTVHRTVQRTTASKP